MRESLPRTIAPLDPTLVACMGPPPLYEGESVDEYNAFWDALRRAVGPRDAVEELNVRSVVDAVWDGRRYRRIKLKLLESSRASGLWRVLGNLVPNHGDRVRLMTGWAQGKAAVRAEVQRLLDEAQLDMSHVEAQTLVAHIAHVDALDRLSLQAERRIDAVLREIDRRRDSLGRRARNGLDAVEDAEIVTTVPAPVPDDDIIG